MEKDIFRPLITCKKNQREEFIYKNTIGIYKDYYFDYTASGLGFLPIEQRTQEALKTYANTHSKEASLAQISQKYYEEARARLKKNLRLNDDFALLPCGYGATGAIKKAQELLGVYIPPATKKRYKINIKKEDMPLVIVGPYEHHSNELSFRESLSECIRVPLDEKGLIDFEYFEDLLKKNQDRELIISFCIASNVSGIISPYQKISALGRKYKALVCFDAAASSAYMNIDSMLFDVMFLSPHKLLGGPGSCGLLAIKKSLIDTSLAPSFSGGGTVAYVSRTTQNYESDIELREDAGTPPILELIRASLAFQLRNELGFSYIMERKKDLMEYFLAGLKKIPNCVIYGNEHEKNIGIISFNLGKKNPYDLCKLLSDKQIQTRAGCSCAGPYGHDLLNMQDKETCDIKPGWLRVSIHFSHTKKQISKLLLALESL